MRKNSLRYEMSEEGAWWKDVLTSTCPYYLTCVPKTDINPHITAAVSVVRMLLKYLLLSYSVMKDTWREPMPSL